MFASLSRVWLSDDPLSALPAVAFAANEKPLKVVLESALERRDALLARSTEERANKVGKYMAA